MKVIKKNAEGYGYNYTDLEQITKLCENMGIEYDQEIEPTEHGDYIITNIYDAESGELIKSKRGAKVVEAKLAGKDNPVQAYGAALTYCRRYSLLLALGLATTDNDAEDFTRNTITEKEAMIFKAVCESKGKTPNKGYENMTPAQYAKALKALENV